MKIMTLHVIKKKKRVCELCGRVGTTDENNASVEHANNRKLFYTDVSSVYYIPCDSPNREGLISIHEVMES